MCVHKRERWSEVLSCLCGHTHVWERKWVYVCMCVCDEGCLFCVCLWERGGKMCVLCLLVKERWREGMWVLFLCVCACVCACVSEGSDVCSLPVCERESYSQVSVQRTATCSEWIWNETSQLPFRRIIKWKSAAIWMEEKCCLFWKYNYMLLRSGRSEYYYGKGLR